MFVFRFWFLITECIFFDALSRGSLSQNLDSSFQLAQRLRRSSINDVTELVHG